MTDGSGIDHRKYKGKMPTVWAANSLRPRRFLFSQERRSGNSDDLLLLMYEKRDVKGETLMEMLSIEKELQENSYPGRGIIIGKSADGKKAVTAYFIMGRS